LVVTVAKNKFPDKDDVRHAPRARANHTQPDIVCPSQPGFNKLLDLEDSVLDMKAIAHDHLLLQIVFKVDDEFADVGD
jgi:hypothetical protein